MAGIREKKKQKTRQSIIDAAVTLFAGKGYENTSVQELATAAGIGKGTIYGYFKTKSEIFLAFCEDEIEYAFADLARKSNPDTPLLKQLLTLFMGQFRYVTRHHEFGRILAREMTFPKEVTHEMSRGIEERYLKALEVILTRSVQRGELRHDLDLLFVSGHFYALYLLILSTWYNGRFRTEEEIEEALTRLLQQAMQGVTPR
jgi:AcrR family transcriptional regulator